MDIRHPLTPIDRQLIELQQSGHSDLHVLLTKSDKVSRGERLRTLEGGARASSRRSAWRPRCRTFPALQKEGIGDVHAVLDDWLFGVPLARME